MAFHAVSRHCVRVRGHGIVRRRYIYRQEKERRFADMRRHRSGGQPDTEFNTYKDYVGEGCGDIAVFFVTTYLSRELVRYRVKIHFLAINFGLVLLQSILTVLEVKYYIVFSVIITLIVAVINFRSVYGTVRDLLSRRGRNAVKADEDENKTEAIENE